MFAFKLLILSGVLAVVSAGVIGNGRQFLPSDIKGDYSRFVKQGSCAKTVNITASFEIAPGAYSVPHTAITEEGSKCTGDGRLTIISKEAIVASGNENVLNTAQLKPVVSALEDQGATFMVGFERVDRKCGSGGTSAGSVIVFVEEEKKINIPGLITLFPGAKYMIVYEPSSPTPCTYFAKFEDRVIGIPSTPAPTDLVDPISSAESEAGEPEASTESSPSASKEPIDSSAGKPEASPVSVPVTTVPTKPSTAATPAAAAETPTEDVDTITAEEVFGPITGEPEETDEDDGGSVCFPADASVELDDGSLKRMNEIELGDRVKVASGVFSPVFMFTHKMSSVSYSFIRLSTASGAQLRLTKGHYLYVNGFLAAAKSVRVGDVLLTENGTTVVTRASTVTSSGLYNPQTAHGDIIVDGIVTSTYTTTVELRTAHTLLSPIRALFSLTGWSISTFDNGADSLAAMVPSGAVVA